MVRLREIKPGMVVECKTDEELKILLEEAERLGYLWAGGKKPTKEINKGRTIHFYGEREWAKYKHITWSDKKGNTEFSDLIIPELSAEEVLNICHQICEEQNGCDNCFCEKDCFADRSSDARKIIEICEQWKADHEKKEPELEWVDICRIIEIQSNGFKKCVHEEDIKPNEGSDYIPEVRAERFLFDYISSHDGNYIAVVERVCRVKKGD